MLKKEIRRNAIANQIQKENNLTHRIHTMESETMWKIHHFHSSIWFETLNVVSFFHFGYGVAIGSSFLTQQHQSFTTHFFSHKGRDGERERETHAYLTMAMELKNFKIQDGNLEISTDFVIELFG